MISPIRTQHSYETARLSLRPIRKSDAGLIGLYAGDIRVSVLRARFRILCRPGPLTPLSPKRRILRASRMFGFWMAVSLIWRRSSG